MTEPRLIVELDGEVTLDSLAKALAALNGLHREICREMTGDPDAVQLRVVSLEVTG